MHELPPLLFVSLVAVIAPFLAARTGSLRIPSVVFEIVLGVVIGPQCLHLVDFQKSLPFLSTMGMAFLFFLAGTEIDLSALRGTPLKRAVLAWLGSLVLAGLAANALSHFGGARAWTLVAVALSTTALGIVVPVLRDAELIPTELGRYAMAAGAAAEIGPIMLMSLLLSRKHGVGVESGLIVLFIAIAIGVFWASHRIRPPGLIRLLTRTMTQSGQLPTRVSILLIAVLVVLAELFELDLALGAFAAGMAVGLAQRDAHNEVLHHKFDAIGFGFLVPVFFISSGIKLDVRSLFATPGNVATMFVYAALLLVVRGLPSAAFAGLLSRRELAALGFYSATTLSLIVALTGTAVERGFMAPNDAAALIGGGLISVLIYPVIATRLAGRGATFRAPQAEEILE
jgi:Kef-type K+ transport system membrane component KefB